MTTYTDSFASLVTPPWVKVIVAGGTDITTLSTGLVYSTGAANYLAYALDSTAISSITAGSPTIIDLGTPHGYGAGEQFAVAISGATAGTGLWALVNDHHIATRTGANTFTIPVDTTAATWAANGTAYYNKKTTLLTDAQQDISALVTANAYAASSYVTLWARFDVRGGPLTALRAGYGVQLEWTAVGAPTCRILKVDPVDGTFHILSSTTELTFYKNPVDTELEVTQLLRMVTLDEPVKGGSVEAVRIRVYVNEDDEGHPTMEYIDRGAGDAPIHRAAGTWALGFGGASTVLADSFDGSTTYVLPTFGAGREGHRTLSALRSSMTIEMARGSSTNLDSDELNIHLNDAVVDVLDFLGDAATWLWHIETQTLTADSEKLVTMKYDVDVVDAVWEAVSKSPVRWNLVVSDAASGRRKLYLEDEPGGRSYTVRYREKWQPMVNDTDTCPVPQRFDELVRLNALMRLADARRDPDYSRTIMERYYRRRREVMSFLQRVKRMEHPRLTVNVSEESTSRIGAAWQLRGPY